MYGFLGRDHHPEKKDEGAVGYVVKAHIEFYGDRDASEIPLVRDAYGGEVLGEDEVAVYRVGTRVGRILRARQPRARRMKRSNHGRETDAEENGQEQEEGPRKARRRAPKESTFKAARKLDPGVTEDLRKIVVDAAMARA